MTIKDDFLELYNCYLEDKYSKNFEQLAERLTTSELKAFRKSIDQVVDHENILEVYEISKDPHIKKRS